MGLFQSKICQVVCLFAILWLPVTDSAAQQNKWTEKWFEVDTTVVFRNGFNEYGFLFEGRSQTFFLDTLQDDSPIQQIRVRIKNNTGATIKVNRVYGTDGAITWIGQYDQEVKNGAYYEISLLFYYRPGNFYRPIMVEYEKEKGQKLMLFIHSFGFIRPRNEKVIPQKPVSKTQAHHKAPEEKVRPGHEMKVKQTTSAFPGNDSLITELYYSNGCIRQREYVTNRVIEYSQSVCGCKIRERERAAGNDDITYTYENCQVHMKTRWRKGINGELKNIIVEKGRFRNGRLFDGTVTYQTASGQPVFEKRMVDGVLRTDFIYNGKRVNVTDSLGRRQGPWIFTGSHCTERTNYTETQPCSKCRYKNGQVIDTVFIYDPSGQLKGMQLPVTAVSPVFKREFYPSGNVYREFYGKDMIHLDSTILYSDSIPGCRRLKFLPDQTEFGYTSCAKSSKTSPRFAFRYSMEQPIDFSIPYTIEKGRFRNDSLVEGVIEYYDEHGKLLRKERVKRN